MSAVPETRIFVYGTLRKACGHELHGVLQRAARYVGSASVRGVLYDLGSYPGLVISGADLDRVTGELYLLHPDLADATLARLDAYEGCAASDPEPHEYRRDMVRVAWDDGLDLAAWTYVLNRPHVGLQRISSGDYLAWRSGGDR